ncbi:MAG: type I-C CRISPR-associated protein Cas7/Csd2 [Roseburia sp.]|nr:type I-C CRISPR-associated protein Cas7/Csd2 [Roseburia sp.]
MSVLENKIDFVAVVSVRNANPNGDPLNGNRPRTNYDDFGEISDVCIKRKIRNRMQDMGQSIFVQSDSRKNDTYDCLSKRASGVLGKIKDKEEYAKRACEEWLDVRTFGQVFAFKATDKDGVSVGVRGPVSIHLADSVFPVEVETMQITKSVNSEPGEKKTSDTMGMKHFVRYGVYLIKGTINVQLAEKTGFSQEDADVMKECLRTLFVNDASSARPEGSMEVVKLFWWKHHCKEGQYSSAKVHRSLKVEQREKVVQPDGSLNEAYQNNIVIADCLENYAIVLEPMDGLEPEIIDGI